MLTQKPGREVQRHHLICIYSDFSSITQCMFNLIFIHFVLYNKHLTLIGFLYFFGDFFCSIKNFIPSYKSKCLTLFLRKTRISWHTVQEQYFPGCTVTPLHTPADLLQGISSAAAATAFFAEPPRHFGFGRRRIQPY